MGMREHRYENKERLSLSHRYGQHVLTIAVRIRIAAEVFPELLEVLLCRKGIVITWFGAWLGYKRIYCLTFQVVSTVFVPARIRRRDPVV